MAAEGRCSVASLGDDLAVEILSRLPVKSLYRSKCVSKDWQNLITHPDHRRKLPQTLAGIFHGKPSDSDCLMPAIDFINLSGEKGTPMSCPSLSFLPAEYHKRIVFSDCCNGLLLLLLLRSSDPRYIVCNPATEKWVALPASTSTTITSQQQAGSGINVSSCASLCFDPAVSPHFHVVEFTAENITTTVHEAVYSSKTGKWSDGHGDLTYFSFFHKLRSPTAFFNGCLHFIDRTAVTAIDMERKTWREALFVPPGGVLCGSLHMSQNRLHYVNYEMDRHSRIRFAVYVLNDDDGCGEPRSRLRSRWTLKHSVGIEHLFDGISYFAKVVMHPDSNLIFFIDWRNNALKSYDMDRQMVQVVCNLGPDTHQPYLPYVPFYSEFGHGSLT